MTPDCTDAFVLLLVVLGFVIGVGGLAAIFSRSTGDDR